METHLRDSHRTVVVSGVPDYKLSPERMVDKLTVHFQSPKRSQGGDVEVVTYPTNIEGLAYVTFDKAEDAEHVVRKKPQILTDDSFSEDVLLTVFPLTPDMSVYVSSATVDLSAFGSDQASLIEGLCRAHRSLRFQPLQPHLSEVTVEGPFAALKALRHDLIQQARELQSTDSPPTAEQTDLLLNPSVMSQFDSGGSSDEERNHTEDHGSSHHRRTESVKDLDFSVSDIQTRLENVQLSSEKEAGHTDESSVDTDVDVDTEIYVDSYTFKYIQRFDRKELDRCLEGLKASEESIEGSGLMRINLSESAAAISTAQRVSKNLSRLVENWMSILRVYHITFDEQMRPHSLSQICKDVDLTFNDVLYLLEDSCITIVGSSVSSLHFYQEVLDKVKSKSG